MSTDKRPADLTTLYTTQISLSEWFAHIGHGKTEQLRKEDNEKRERLKVLHEIIGLPYDQPHQFMATELAIQSPAFKTFLKEHGHELCALRLIPLDPSLPKLRMRGHTVTKALDWFAQQQIDPTQYRVDFVPHAEESTWATIFIVNTHGIFGEIIRGGHHQLTQGAHDQGEPITFAFDFSSWQMSKADDEALKQIKEILGKICVDGAALRQKISLSLGGTFIQDYLLGYFETATSKEFGTWFIDYSPMLGELYHDVMPPKPSIVYDKLLNGRVGCRGQARGRARLVLPSQIKTTELRTGDILICPNTTPEYVPLMQKASAIVTDQGGILSHAAIIARELGIPCIVGTKSATSTLKEGDMIDVDAHLGVIKKIDSR